MTGETLLWRQIHPDFVQAGRVTSQAFRPTPKDKGALSACDGDRINAESAWRRYTEVLRFPSCGVLAVSVSECETYALAVEADGDPFPEHVSILFIGMSSKQREGAAKRLRDKAASRGWQYQAP